MNSMMALRGMRRERPTLIERSPCRPLVACHWWTRPYARLLPTRRSAAASATLSVIGRPSIGWSTLPGFLVPARRAGFWSVAAAGSSSAVEMAGIEGSADVMVMVGQCALAVVGSVWSSVVSAVWSALFSCDLSVGLLPGVWSAVWSPAALEGSEAEAVVVADGGLLVVLGGAVPGVD